MNINAISADCNCNAMQNAVLYFYVTNLMNAIDYVTLCTDFKIFFHISNFFSEERQT